MLTFSRLRSQLRLFLLILLTFSIILFFILTLIITAHRYQSNVEYALLDTELQLLDKNYYLMLDANDRQPLFSDEIRKQLVNHLPYWWQEENFFLLYTTGETWGEICTQVFPFQQILNIDSARKIEMIHKAMSKCNTYTEFDSFCFLPYRAIACKTIGNEEHRLVVILVSCILDFKLLLFFLLYAIFITCMMVFLSIFLSNRFSNSLINNCNKLIAEIRNLSGHSYKKPINVSSLSLHDELKSLALSVEEMRQKIDSQMYFLENHAREQSEFAGNVAHELQTPIANTSNWVQLLIDLPDIDRHKKNDYLNRIINNINTLSATVQNLLILSRIHETDGLIHNNLMQATDFNVKKRILSLTDLPMQKWQHKKQFFSCNIEDDLVLHSIPALFDIIFSNLLDNALKYAPTQTKIMFTATDNRTYDHTVLFSLSNDGDLLSQKDIPLLSRKFFRLGKDCDIVSGWGIGLYLVKKAIYLLDARIYLKPRTNGGLTAEVIIKDVTDVS